MLSYYRTPHARAILHQASTVRLPQNLLTSPGTTLEDFETTTGWTVNNGTLANDAVHFKTGSQAVEWTSVAGGLARATKAVSWSCPNNQEIRLWAYVPDVTLITAGTMQIMLAGNAGMDVRFHVYPTIQEGWNLFSFKNADWTILNNMAWATTIVYTRLQFNGEADVQGVCSYDTLAANVVARPAIVLTFDDAHASVYDYALPAMDAHNIPGTFYVWTANVNQPSNVTPAQLLALQAAGWCIANHTQTHTNLTTLNQAETQAEFAAAKADLEGWGITGDGPSHVSYPGGNYNATTLAAMAAAGMLTGRHISARSYPVLPFTHPYEIGAEKQFGNTLSLEDAEAWIDDVISRSEIGVALLHNLVESPGTAYEWGISDFQDLCQYLGSQGVPCITIDEAYQLQSAPVTCRRAD